MSLDAATIEREHILALLRGEHQIMHQQGLHTSSLVLEAVIQLIEEDARERQ